MHETLSTLTVGRAVRALAGRTWRYPEQSDEHTGADRLCGLGSFRRVPRVRCRRFAVYAPCEQSDDVHPSWSTFQRRRASLSARVQLPRDRDLSRVLGGCPARFESIAS